MPPQKTACVTGATGYVASELIRQLLGRGYAVKATVRCAVDAKRLQYLRDQAEKSEGSLQLVQVPDIEHDSEALDGALAGVAYVFHVASPFRFDGAMVGVPESLSVPEMGQAAAQGTGNLQQEGMANEAIDKGAVSAPAGDPKLDIVQPAVEGTKTVLRAAAKHKGAGLQRVVVTSSVCGGCFLCQAGRRMCHTSRVLRTMHYAQPVNVRVHPRVSRHVSTLAHRHVSPAGVAQPFTT